MHQNQILKAWEGIRTVEKRWRFGQSPDLRWVSIASWINGRTYGNAMEAQPSGTQMYKGTKKDWTAESAMIWRSSQSCLKIEPKSEFQMNLSVWRSVMSTGYILLLILSLSHPLSHLNQASDKWLQYFLSLICSASFNLEKYAAPNNLHNKHRRQTYLGEEKYYKWVMLKF